MGVIIGKEHLELLKIVEKSDMSLFYGVAGAGKTTLLLTMARYFCKQKGPCLYVSTEETLHYEIVSRFAEEYQETLFTEIYDLDKLVELSFFLGLLNFKIVFIDSINSLYRVVAYQEAALPKFSFLMGLMKYLAHKGVLKVLASAQVRAGDEDIEASGMSLLDYYFDIIFQVGLEEGKRFLKLVKPMHKKPVVGYFEISDKGVEWV
ncbi:MAG: AAA family ATPase [Thermosphaera sp.]